MAKVQLFHVIIFVLLSLSCCCTALNGIVKTGIYTYENRLETIQPFGLKMCAIRCFRRKDCNSFTFDKNIIQCALHYEIIQDNLVSTDVNGHNVYSNIDSWTGFTGACFSSQCGSAEICNPTASSRICSPILKPCSDPYPTPARHSTAIVSVTQVTYVCHNGYVVRGISLAVCVGGLKWSTPSYKCHPALDGWILVSRFTKEIGTKTYTSYTAVGTDSDDDAAVEDACFSVSSTGCTHHYRSGLLDDWATLPIEQAKIGLYTAGVEKQSVVYNADGTTYTNWLTDTAVNSSTWSDVVPGMTSTYMSIAGSSNGYVERRFYLAAHHAGCSADAGWMIVLDGTGDCAFDQHPTYPVFLYSSTSTFSIFQSVKPCPNSYPPAARHSIAVASRSFTEVKYVCEAGYVVRGTDVSKCQDGVSWSTPSYKCHPALDGWILVSRFTKEIGTKTYTSYTAVGTDSDDDMAVEDACFSVSSTGCTHHYRSGLLDVWGSLSIEQVKLGLYTAGVEKQYVILTASGGTTYTNWLLNTNVVTSTWSDVVATMTPDFMSIAGISNAVIDRRFYVTDSHAGCLGDRGWMMVLDGTGECGFDQHPNYPVFMYSAATTSTVFATGLAQADVFAVFLKITGLS